jgi:hypothetical protein
MEERDPIERRIREEEEAAAAEARGIGGPAPDDDFEPEMRAVYEGGGGEAEGFEMAEDQLIDNASHGDGTGDPLSDAFSPEAESDRSSAEYGEADEEDASELVVDPDSDPDSDPGVGPGLTQER